MQLLPPFLFIFAFISICFGVSRAVDCRSNENDKSKVAYTITVDKSRHHGNFIRIQDAIDSIPSGNDKWIRIHVHPGIYMETVYIPRDKPCILLEGDNARLTIISWNGHDRTDTSATFTSLPDNIVARGITFKNSYNRAPELNDYKPTQALAARIYGDKSAFHQCGFMGFQDTLWDVEGRHYFKSCYIEGAVDFIWGSGQSYYEDCLINVTAGLLPPQISAGYITAQGRSSSKDHSGFVFERGIIFGSGQAYLGRAYGPYSRVIFHGTMFTAVVAPEGWFAWVHQGHEGHFTYAEVDCKGPGSDTSKRVKWEKHLDASELYKFTRSSFIDQDRWIAKQP